MTSCSQSAAAEPLAGTAPSARAWIVIEQPGPWGRDALLDSHLDPGLGQHLSAAKTLGLSVLLARHPDRPERSRTVERHVWVARTAAGGMLLRRGLLADVSDLRGWDLEAIAGGQLPPFGTVDARPCLFVCTSSGRDRCCAVHGRALIAALMERARPEQRERVWECSHVGGHRFAPVTLSLPSGAVHGRLGDDEALDLLERTERGNVLLPRLRGRSCFSAPFQVAAIAVQLAHGIDAVDDLDVLRIVNDRAVPPASSGRPDPGPALPDRSLRAEVRHQDGRVWRAKLVEAPLEEARLESCGGEPREATHWTCTDLEPAPNWS